jgi:hypothetical protein
VSGVRKKVLSLESEKKSSVWSPESGVKKGILNSKSLRILSIQGLGLAFIHWACSTPDTGLQTSDFLVIDV